jgi:glutamate/tyrosine decarboxylase-like PLP-dependent enzyme
MQFPEQGTSREDLTSRLREAVSRDADWRGGKIFSLVYFAGDDVAEVLKEAYITAFYTNGLGPAAFKSLKKFESEVIAMTGDLLNHPDAAGNMTSGGTESILMAVKTARDWARAEKGITNPRMIIPVTAHPAFDKAAHYLGVEVVHTPLREDLRADAQGMRDAITDNTILLAGSAPCYPFGVIDPIPEIAALAAERGVLCHVDACLGAYLLPFVERLGRPVAPWDFRVAGVTSISADLHKYGYSARGASVILYRDRDLRRHQFFATSDWPGGLYGSPTLAGSRPGGAIAAAWAVLNYLGVEGYTRLARIVMDTTDAITDGINGIPEMRVVGEPDMSVFTFTSDSLDIHSVADALDEAGWHPDRQQNPSSLHCMVTPAHENAVQPFLSALENAVERVRTEGAAPSGKAAMYGMLDKLPDRGKVHDMVLDSIDRLTQVKPDASSRD